jgi:hypothetical protein
MNVDGVSITIRLMVTTALVVAPTYDVQNEDSIHTSVHQAASYFSKTTNYHQQLVFYDASLKWVINARVVFVATVSLGMADGII